MKRNLFQLQSIYFPLLTLPCVKRLLLIAIQLIKEYNRIVNGLIKTI